MINTSQGKSGVLEDLDGIHKVVETDRFRLRKVKNGIVTTLMEISNRHDVFTSDTHFKMGFTMHKENKVIILSNGLKMSILMSVDNSNFVKILEYEPMDINQGLVGVGTFKCKARFTKLKLRPPILHLTESEKRQIMNDPINGILSPKGPWELQKQNTAKESTSFNAIAVKLNHNEKILDIVKLISDEFSTNLEKHNNLASNIEEVIDNKTYHIDQGFSRTWDDSGFKDYKKKVTKDFVTGWEVCIKNKTNEDRSNFCKMTKIEIFKERCNKDFCYYCCHENVSEGKVNIIHTCLKICHASTQSKTNYNEFEKIIHPKNPDNVYYYCDTRLHGRPKGYIQKCKLDMCNLGCSTFEHQYDVKISTKDLSVCFSKCSNGNFFI